jgi:hypothetical protein
MAAISVNRTNAFGSLSRGGEERATATTSASTAVQARRSWAEGSCDVVEA